MTKLQELRNYVGVRGNWDKFGICALPFVVSFDITKTFLVCEAGSKQLFESAYPDITDVIEQISEARAAVILEVLKPVKELETAAVS